jgi:DNA-binding MarR family transcriptional regulator
MVRASTVANEKERARHPIPRLGPTLEFLTLLWELDHELAAASSRMKRAFGITAQQRMIIRILGRVPNLTAGQLAGLLRIHPGTLSTALARLERRGLLVRRKSAGDRRRVIITLTAEGSRLDVPSRSTVESAVAKVLADVNRREALVVGRVVRRLTNALKGQSMASADRSKSRRAERP